MIKLEAPQLKKISESLQKAVGSYSKNSQAIFKDFADSIYAKIKERSPVDEGDYRDDWKINTIGNSGYIISNHVAYSEVMETGSPVGGSPWPSVGPKTVAIGGRIWSNQRPEPVMLGAVESANWERLERDLLNSLTKGI